MAEKKWVDAMSVFSALQQQQQQQHGNSSSSSSISIICSLVAV
jgi:hypothetical protein